MPRLTLRPRLHRPLRIAALSLFVGTLTLPALAEISPAEIAQLEATRGAQVLSQDGALVGVVAGASVSQDRARLFLSPVRGSTFRRKGKDIIISTSLDQLSLVNGNVVLVATEDRIKRRANFSETDEEAVTILLLAR